jgi:type VI secretion system protein ImpA
MPVNPPKVPMPAAAAFDVDSLIAPLAGQDPAGDPRAYVYRLREQLAELRRQEEPEDFDDATRPADLKQADWPGVVRRCEEALSAETKDLRVAVYLLEGLANTRGFAGLAEGLEILARLIGEAWDRLNPPLADGDLDERAAPLANMLDDSDHGLRFPLTIRAIPLIGGLGYTQWLTLRASSAANDQQTAAAALNSLKLEAVQELDRQIAACQANLKTLLATCDQRMGAEAPSLSTVAAALDDCRRVAAQELQRLAPGSAPTATTASGPTATRSRSDAYTQLDRAADVLLELEPHSPIPYLVKRAVKLGRLPFPQLMQRMIRDGNVLAELSRELDLDAAGAASK